MSLSISEMIAHEEGLILANKRKKKKK